MSLAALKRKSFVVSGNSRSRPNGGFQLNGAHRSQGFVGQDTRGRHLSHSLMRGSDFRGHGGCCGVYDDTRFPEMVSGAVVSTENSNVCKPTVMNTAGMLASSRGLPCFGLTKEFDPRLTYVRYPDKIKPCKKVCKDKHKRSAVFPNDCGGGQCPKLNPF